MRFLLACEGQSDTGLVSHIERLIVAHCAETDVEGHCWHHHPSLTTKVGTGLRAAGEVDVLFVHRDANSAGWETRRSEIQAVVATVADAPRSVAVIPVRMTEAWLLLDESAIRRVVGNPAGRAPLGLPTPNEAERRADPKQILGDAFLAASEATGRRRKKIRRDFGRLRRRLLADLPISGPLEELRSWVAFREETLCALAACGN